MNLPDIVPDKGSRQFVVGKQRVNISVCGDLFWQARVMGYPFNEHAVAPALSDVGSLLSCALACPHLVLTPEYKRQFSVVYNNLTKGDPMKVALAGLYDGIVDELG